MCWQMHSHVCQSLTHLRLLRGSLRHVTPLMTWRDEARFFISPPSSLLFESKVRCMAQKPRHPLHPHPLHAHFVITSLSLFVQSFQRLPMLVACIVCVSRSFSVRYWLPFVSARSLQRKCNSHFSDPAFSVPHSPPPFLHCPSLPQGIVSIISAGLCPSLKARD